MTATMYVHTRIDMVKGHESVNQTSAATKRQGIPTINSVRVKILVTTSLHILGEETLNGYPLRITKPQMSTWTR